MPVPDFQSMMLPVLKALADGKPHSATEISEIVALAMGVSEADRLEELPSGTATKWANRIAWVGTHFNFAKFISRPKRGQWQITERGIEVLKSDPKVINLKSLQKFDDYNEARLRKKDGGAQESESEEQAITPQEVFEKSFAELRKALATELLELVKSKPPIFLERLVLQLMQRLGYGSLVAEATEHLGGKGDGGVDGLIKEDKLGLDVIYVQAKRFGDAPVTPKIVREFLGALDQAGAKKGVLITTSTFTKDAKAPLGKTDKKISLIEGQMLAELMIDHDLGVAPGKAFQLKKIDSDFFED